MGSFSRAFKNLKSFGKAAYKGFKTASAVFTPLSQAALTALTGSAVPALALGAANDAWQRYG